VRVLYFTGGFSPHDRRFVKALLDAGMEISFLSYDGSALEESKDELPAGVEHVIGISNSSQMRWISVPGHARRVRSIVQGMQPDVIHAGPMHQGALLTALADAHPFVSMSWGSDLLAGARRGLPRWAARFTFSRSDAFIGDCQAVRMRAIELGMAQERIVTFPWGVDLERFTPVGDAPLRAQLGWQDAAVLVSTRAWEPLYGVDILLQAFLKASSQDGSLRLLLVGGGSQRALLEEMIRKAGAQKKVHLIERVSEVELPGYYRSANLYLSASHSDGSSVSLLEAMACGLPVLVSDIPGNREWVEARANGWLFPDGDVGALTEAILRSGQSSEDLKAAGVHGREIAVQRADWAKNQRRLVEAYEMAIQYARERTA
jgi:glycosyltransferase involved in cell wall biosynthesis